MSLETSTTIAGLVASNPPSSDSESQGCSHLQMIKNVLKLTFPGAAGAGFAIPITASEAELNFVKGVTSAIQAQLNTIVAGGIPSGLIAMWKGSIITIPTGWVLCDGLNGTPDLRDKFVAGAGNFRAVGAIGGSADATLVLHGHTATSTFNGIALPTHNHTDSGHAHTYTSATGAGGVTGITTSASNVSTGSVTSVSNANLNPASAGTPTGTVTTTMTNTGASATDANLPPYYAIAFIMKT